MGQIVEHAHWKIVFTLINDMIPIFFGAGGQVASVGWILFQKLLIVSLLIWKSACRRRMLTTTIVFALRHGMTCGHGHLYIDD